MKPEQDAYGREVYDFYLGEPATEIIERDDGYVGTSGGPAAYFTPYAEWSPAQQEAIGLARGQPEAASGRCLDIGCSPGRVCLYLQEQGHDVVGIDNSPLVIQTATRRGVKDARVLSITQASRQKLGFKHTYLFFSLLFDNTQVSRTMGQVLWQ